MAGRKSILIVEDEPMIGLMLEDFLDSLGYGVAGSADSVGAACQRARDGGFDAAILDCNVSDGKVWPVADLLIERGVPFLFATGGSSDELPPHLAHCPALEKPFTMASVESALEALFAAK